MSDRRYEVWAVEFTQDTEYSVTADRTRLDSIPDALVEEAAKAIDIVFAGDGSSARLWRVEARAALGVLFPGEEEEENEPA